MKKIYFCVFILLQSCDGKNYNNWSTNFNHIGSFSSPRAIDLNADGVLDIVVGTGAMEWQPNDTSVIALDGKNGNMLWHVSGRNQMVGSAIFMDINNDGTKDVFIGGRSAELKAIDGKSGKVIWEFFKTRDPFLPKKYGWFNFTNPQFVPDQNKDGFNDILVSNGGDATLLPDNKNRPCGKLLIISGLTGKIIAQAIVPDGNETYMSVVVYKEQDTYKIIFGSGGETIGGHFYKTTLAHLLNNDICMAEVLAETKDKGFVGPPVLADINKDGIYDIVCNVANGKLIAINGANNKKLWEVSIPFAEAYTSPGIGNFTDDDVPDFFCNYAIGVWPSFLNAVQILVNGKTGKIIRKYQIGNFSYSSPLCLDYNKDGHDDILLNINYKAFTKNYEQHPFQKLIVFDFYNNKMDRIGDSIQGINWASTPLITDIDNDGSVDILYSCSFAEEKDNPETFSHKNQTSITFKKNAIKGLGKKYVKWGGYMGNNGDGVYLK